jgi:hypothetical protein
MTTSPDNQRTNPAINPGRRRCPPSVVVVSLVLALGVHSFAGLIGVAPLGGAQRLLLGRLGSNGGEREQALQILAPAFRAFGNRGRPNERLESVAAAAA